MLERCGQMQSVKDSKAPLGVCADRKTKALPTTVILDHKLLIACSGCFRVPVILACFCFVLYLFFLLTRAMLTSCFVKN